MINEANKLITISFQPVKKESGHDEFKKWFSNLICSFIDDLPKRNIIKNVFDAEDENLLTPEVVAIIQGAIRNFPLELQNECLVAVSSNYYYEQLSEKRRLALNKIDWTGRLKIISLESDLSDKQKQIFLIIGTFCVLSIPGYTTKDFKNNLVKHLEISPEKAEELDNAFGDMIILPVLKAFDAAN